MKIDKKFKNEKLKWQPALMSALSSGKIDKYENKNMWRNIIF